MAVTENSYTGNGSTTNYSFTFPYLKATDIEVQVNASVVTNWSLANATTIQFNSAPSNGDKIKILRQTSVDELAATFYAGSAIKSEDLNDNYTQNLYKTQEVGNRFFSNTGGTMTGDLTMGEDTVLIFEGATDDAYETTLSVVDPTADRAVNLPNEDGTLIVSSSTTTVNVGSKDIHTTGHIDLVDDSKIKLGSSDDLQLYHGSNSTSYINNVTGHLYIQNSGSNDNSNIYIRARNEDDSIICKDDGAVELYFNNIKKFETTSSGATVTGKLVADDLSLGDNDKLFIGNDDDLTIWHSGVNSYIDNKASGHLYMRANTTGSGGNIYIQAQSGENSIICNDNGAVLLYNNDSKKFETTAAGATVTGVLTATVTGDVTGNASTATALETARTLGGVSFDGTANINLPGVNAAGNQNTSGNAATATALANARTIGGVSFDGTANINLPGVNAGGNQDTSGNAATATAATALATSRDFSATGEVTASAVGFTGAGNVALSTVISSNIVDEDNLKISNSGSDGQYLQKQSGNAGGLTWASPGGGTATAIATVNEATDTTCFPLFGTSATGDLQPKTNANLTFNSNTGAFTAADISIPNDTGKLTLGTGGDLEIFHDGSNSYIKDAGTGNLEFISNIHDFRNAGDSAYLARLVQSDRVELYYDGSKKIETTSVGMRLSGNYQANDGYHIYLGTGNDLDLYHDGSNSYITDTGTGELYIQGNSFVSIRDSVDGDTLGKFIKDGAVELYYNNVKKLETIDNGITVYGPEGADGLVKIYADEGDDNADQWSLVALNAGGFLLRNYTAGAWEWNIAAYGNGAVELYYDHSKKVSTASDGITVYGRIAADELDMGDNEKVLLGAGDDLSIFHNGTNSEIKNATGILYLESDGTWITDKEGSDKMAKFLHDAGVELYYDNALKFKTDSNGSINYQRSIWHSNSDEDEGMTAIYAWDQSVDADASWIKMKRTDADKPHFAVDGRGRQFNKGYVMAGTQSLDDNTTTRYYPDDDYIGFYAHRGITDGSAYRDRVFMRTASADWDDRRCFYYVSSTDDAAVDYDQDQTISFTGSGRLNCKKHIWAGRVESDEGSPNSVYAGAETGILSYADDGTDQTYIYARNNADSDKVIYSEVNNEANFSVEADGTCKADDTTGLSNADYAECFEWTDGNASDQERRGMTVVLDGEKVKLATDSDNKDNIIGVVSPNPAVLGDSASLGWHGRYKKDIYGTAIRKPQEWLVWRKEYHYKDGVKVLCEQPDPNNRHSLDHGDVERVRVEDIEKQKAKNLIPDFAITNNLRYTSYGKDIDTTDYDSTKAYIPRKDRKEWDAIGMVGKLIVRRGQPVGTRWLLMKENIGTDTDGTVLDRYLVR